MVYELRKAGLYVEQQAALSVSYKEIVFCEFVADLIVKREILIELKAIEQLAPTFSAQCINYLAATRLPICLLINFSGRVEVKRFAGPALRSVP